MKDLTYLSAVRLEPVIEVPAGVLTEAESRMFERSDAGEDGDWPDDLAELEVTQTWPVRLCSDPGFVQRVLLAEQEKFAEAMRRVGADVPSRPRLEGGICLCSGEDEILGRMCCSDLGNLADWREASGYRGAEWEMLWIGHPSLSVRYQSDFLVLSEPHESGDPVPRWAVRPEELAQAAATAEAELEDFARVLETALAALGQQDPRAQARKLVHLTA